MTFYTLYSCCTDTISHCLNIEIFHSFFLTGMIPVHTSLPTTVQFAENVAVGTFVTDVKVKDWNYEEWKLTGDVLEYAILTEATHFAIDSSGEVIFCSFQFPLSFLQ